MNHWPYIRADIRRLLSLAGITLLLLAAIRFLGIFFPLGLLLPGWYLGLARELINISPVIMTGLTMHLIARRIAFADQAEPFNPMPWIGDQRLLRGLAVIFALLIPVQIGAAFLFDANITKTQRLQLQSVQSQLAMARKQQSVGNSSPQINQLQAIEVGLKTQQRQTSRRRFALFVESLGICLSAAVLVWVLTGALRLRPR
jgi:hypothetical protein